MKNVAIKENHLYQKAYQRGRRFVTPTVAVYVLRDLAARRLAHAHPQKKIVNRLGLSVSKKIGSAVARNRAKRVIRAAYDPIRDELRTGFLVVISAREAIRGKKATDVQKDLQKAFAKLDMLKEPQNRGNTQTP